MVGSAILGSTEILQIAEAVAREKGIESASVVEAMEQAIQVAGRRKFGHDHDIHVEIDRKTGAISLQRRLEVVEVVENPATQISLEDAKTRDENIELGGGVFEQLPPIDLGRVTAQTAKQVIVQHVRDAERQRQYEDYKDRVGEVVNGTVKRIEYGNIIVDFGQAEALLRKDRLIGTEMFRQNDRIRAFIEDVRRETKGPQIFLSRSHPGFLASLFKQEVPEIYDGIITVKSVAREPGSRAKMAVHSSDISIDPVGSCVGVRGSRVQAVISELQGEKIDIINWSPEPAVFVVNALAPAEVSKVVLDEEKNRIEIVVPDDQLSLAIGRRGQNVRLASQLTGWSIDVISEDDESKRHVEEFNRLTELFVEALDVEEVLGQLLAVEGFSSVEEVAYVPLGDLASLEGLDEDIAAALRERARNYIDQQNEKSDQELRELGIAPEVAEVKGVTPEILLQLGRADIKTLDDLGDLSREEFKDIVENNPFSDEEIDSMIMTIRESWFASEEGDSTTETEND